MDKKTVFGLQKMIKRQNYCQKDITMAKNTLLWLKDKVLWRKKMIKRQLFNPLKLNRFHVSYMSYKSYYVHSMMSL